MSDTGFNGPSLGETMPGTDDDGNLINSQFLGTIKRFDNINVLGSGSAKVWESHGPVYAVLLRNVSGGALTRRQLALCEASAVGYNLIENASGYGATLYDKPVVAIDPWLSSSGVDDDDIFWGIIKGPTILTLPSSGGDILASGSVGTALVCSADNAGRVTPAAPASDAAVYQAANAVFGSSMTTFTNANTDMELTVLMHCPWFPC